MNSLSNLTAKNTLAIKGMAILLIVLHNFFHILYRVTKENEMDFDPARFMALVNQTAATPTEWVQGFFTFFGHFGVQLFIFLSAYGLSRSYPEVSRDKVSFIVSRLVKIYPTLFIVVGLWLALTAVWELFFQQQSLSSGLNLLQVRAFDAFLVGLGIHNLFPGHGYPIVGPWWFIPFIMQFYLLWALLGNLFFRISKNAILVIAAAGILFNYTATPLVEKIFNINLLYSPLGHIAEIMLGIYCARFGLSIHRKLIYLASAVFILSCLSEYAWPLHHISALILLLALSSYVAAINSGFLLRLLVLFGVYSLPIFLVNGFLRPPFFRLSRSLDIWYIDFGLAAFFVLTTLGFAVIVSKVEKNISGLSLVKKA